MYTWILYVPKESIVDLHFFKSVKMFSFNLSRSATFLPNTRRAQKQYSLNSKNTMTSASRFIYGHFFLSSFTKVGKLVPSPKRHYGKKHVT